MAALGSLGVKAVIADTTTPILGMRWTYTLTKAVGPGLLFQWSQIGSVSHRTLENILHPYTYTVGDGESEGWPPPAANYLAQPGTPWIGSANFTGEDVQLGRASRPRRWPRSNWGVDGIAAAVKPTYVCQGSILLAPTVTVTWTKPRLSARWWRVRVQVGGYPALSMQGDVKGQAGVSIRASEALAFLTEFFDDDAADYAWASWGHAAWQGGRWRPITTFTVHYVPTAVGVRDYGFAAEDGRLVLRHGLGPNTSGETIHLT